MNSRLGSWGGAMEAQLQPRIPRGVEPRVISWPGAGREGRLHPLPCWGAKACRSPGAAPAGRGRSTLGAGLWAGRRELPCWRVGAAPSEGSLVWR